MSRAKTRDVRTSWPEAIITKTFNHNIYYYLAQFFLTAFYWQSGIDKLINFSEATHEMTNLGLPMPALFAAVTVFLQLFGPIVMIFGKRWGLYMAWILIAFTLATLFIAHPVWAFTEDPVRFKKELVGTAQHFTYIGGFMMSALAAHLKYPYKSVS